MVKTEVESHLQRSYLNTDDYDDETSDTDLKRRAVKMFVRFSMTRDKSKIVIKF